MKKIHWILFGLLLLPVGQAAAQSKVNIGTYIGPSMAWWRTDTRGVRADGSIIGMDWGLMIDYLFNDRYIFHTGINVSHRGGKLAYSEGITFRTFPTEPYANNSTVTYTTQWIEVPTQMRLRITQGTGKVLPFVQFGFNTGFRVGGRAGVSGPRSLTRERVGKDLNDFSFGLVAGGGIEYQLNDTNRLLLALLFHNGFTDNINRHEAPTTMGRVSQSYLNFRVGFFF
jgi:Outer membrane protein beta-barrel domain